MSSNSIWYWLTQAIHGTAKLDLSGGGFRYTAVISLTEKTARAIEREKKRVKAQFIIFFFFYKFYFNLFL